MEWQRDDGRRRLVWLALALCAAVAVAGALRGFVPNRPDYAGSFAPNWLPLLAGGLAAAGLLPLRDRPRGPRLQGGLVWAGLLLMVWAANGLPLDLLRVVGLIPLPVDWPGLVIRVLAAAAVVALTALVLAVPPDPAFSHGVRWYGYAAFALALPYPLMRTCWLLGGTLGLEWRGAGGEGFAAWVMCVPWLLAAALSLLLVPTWPWVPRRLLLAAGWFATAVVAMIGPAAFWSLVSAFAGGRDLGLIGIASWVPALFYGSWFLWWIAAGAATRSYQVRSGGLAFESSVNSYLAPR